MSEFSGSNGKSRLVPPKALHCREVNSLDKDDFWKGFCMGALFTPVLILIAVSILERL